MSFIKQAKLPNQLIFVFFIGEGTSDEKIFWITLILCLIMPMCAYAVDGSGFDADEDGVSDGTKVWAVSQPAGYYPADDLTVLFGDPNDNDYNDGVREGPITITNRAELNALRGIVEVNGDLLNFRG